MPVRLLSAGITAIDGIRAFGRESLSAGLADHIRSLFETLFTLVFPKAEIAASFVAVFLAINRSIEDFSATPADDPSDRINIGIRSAGSQTVKIICLQFFLIFLFP